MLNIPELNKDFVVITRNCRLQLSDKVLLYLYRGDNIEYSYYNDYIKQKTIYLINWTEINIKDFLSCLTGDDYEIEMTIKRLLLNHIWSQFDLFNVDTEGLAEDDMERLETSELYGMVMHLENGWRIGDIVDYIREKFSFKEVDKLKKENKDLKEKLKYDEHREAEIQRLRVANSNLASQFKNRELISFLSDRKDETEDDAGEYMTAVSEDDIEDNLQEEKEKIFDVNEEINVSDIFISDNEEYGEPNF